MSVRYLYIYMLCIQTHIGYDSKTYSLIRLLAAFVQHSNARWYFCCEWVVVGGLGGFWAVALIVGLIFAGYESVVVTLFLLLLLQTHN